MIYASDLRNKKTPTKWDPAVYLRRFGYLSAKTNPLGPNQLSPVVPDYVREHPLAPLYLGTISLQSNLLEIEDAHQSLIQTYEFILGQDAPRSIQDAALFRLWQTRQFEGALHHQCPGAKRFSIEGCDTILTILETVLDQTLRGDNPGGNSPKVVLAMAHRGRLAVLHQLFGFSLPQLVSLFNSSRDSSVMDSFLTRGPWGDVKYHLGAKALIKSFDGNNDDMRYDFPHLYPSLELILLPNPSHLESIGPVAMGYGRACQDVGHHDTVCVTIHGDGAVIGQGVVGETLNLHQLPGFSTGGTIHLIIDNQVSFTTDPVHARSTPFCSDIFQGFHIPVIYVNALDHHRVAQAAQIAFSYRHHHHRDIAIHLIGYRRWGHHEADDPTLTQPLVYKKIAKIEKNINQSMELVAKTMADQPLSPLIQATPIHPHGAPPLTTSPLKNASRATARAAPLSLLRLLHQCYQLPLEFHLHHRLKSMVDKFHFATWETELAWGQWETLAFAIILSHGIGIRLCGQDSGRGTFSQRHHLFIDQTCGTPYSPLNALAQEHGCCFEVINSPLSEAAVLGFEYGYSLFQPRRNLVLWEAQFGDFCNGAQVVIDQYLASGQAKWGVTSGLILLLPHGMEGQGPEHSSGRIERFLQLSAQSNWRIIQPSTGSNYGFALYEQAKRLEGQDCCPLIIFTPKSLLRHPKATTKLSGGLHGSWQPFLVSFLGKNDAVRQVILLSGKIYYDLLDLDAAHPMVCHAVVVRVEQLYPLETAQLLAILKPYAHLPWTWLQQEMANQGPKDYMMSVLGELRLIADHQSTIGFVAPPAAATTAPGSTHEHKYQLLSLWDELCKVVSIK